MWKYIPYQGQILTLVKMRVTAPAPAQSPIICSLKIWQEIFKKFTFIQQIFLPGSSLSHKKKMLKYIHLNIQFTDKNGWIYVLSWSWNHSRSCLFSGSCSTELELEPQPELPFFLDPELRSWSWSHSRSCLFSGS